MASLGYKRPYLRKRIEGKERGRKGGRKKREGEARREEGRNKRNNPAYIAETLNPAFPDL